MPGGLIVLILALVVGSIVLVDIRRRQTPIEGPGELAVGQEPEAERQVTRVGGADNEDADQTDRPRAATDLGVPQTTGRFALQNWSVRSRLILLILIPSLTAIGLAIARIVSSLQSAAMVHGTSAAHSRAVTSVILEILLLVVVVVLAVAITAIVGRSMIRPLRTLQAGALDVANHRLPQEVRQISEAGTEAPVTVVPIAVYSTDEFGKVARAFDQVHREALQLAANEAALRGNVNAIFVNLSRRSQSLVERQIRLIDDLEQGEQDPERLSSLFQMDHLATRMRRNSENLLVLAGHEESRRWNQPLALVDVLRASLSEIEQYERVTLDVQPGVVVRGQVVSDVVHLTAELVENSTSFSAVDTPVKISGHLLSSGGALLEITDQGVGMETDQLAHANWRLDNPPVVDVAVSRRMGLFVVARLAGRHGIRIRLRPADTGGLVALVWLPDEAITREAPDAPLNLPARDPGLAALTATEQGAVGRPPRKYAPLIVDMPADATGPDLVGPPAGPQVASVAAAGLAEPEPAAGNGDERETVAAPAAALAQTTADIRPADNRLPIFEAVESDWFRRGGSAVERFGRDGDAGSVWATPASAGWQAAEAVREPVASGTTAAGLPRRTRGANLVPGTAAPPSPTGTPPAMPRSAAATRDRFASFQRGVRQGRAVVGSEGPGDGEAGPDGYGESADET